jgi:hypothetical protein
MKKALLAFLWLTAIVPYLAAVTIVPKNHTEQDSGRIQEAPDQDAAELDSQQGFYDNVSNEVHSRIIEVTNDTKVDHQLIRVHWTVDSDVWLWAFKLRFTYFDDNRHTIKTESRWIYSPNEDGSCNIFPAHTPVEEWHEFTVPSDQASQFKAVSVLVELAYRTE